MNRETVRSEQGERETRELMGRLSDSWARGDARAYGAEFNPMTATTLPSTAPDFAAQLNLQRT
jgi:hypothetical protein